MSSSGSLGHSDALLIIDVQNDFCPQGALPVPSGDAVVPVLNSWIARAARSGCLVLASRDWHPEGHISFERRGGVWPPHCIQDTFGAGFHPGLRLPTHVIKITKGTRFDKDQHSAFDETGLANLLRRENVERIWIGGLALDVCVRASVLDALRYGFQAMVIAKGSRGLTQSGATEATNEMKAAGATIVR